MEDPSVQAQILCHKLGIFRMNALWEMAERIKFIAGEGSLEAARIHMEEMWAKYRASRGRLKWAYASAMKFFEWDCCMDEDQWPYEAARGVSVARYDGPEMSLETVNEIRKRIGEPPLKSL